MTSDILIRKAVPQDIATMVELLKLLFDLETDFSFDGEKQRRGLELMLQGGPHRYLLVAEQNRRVIGMCSAQLLISTAEGASKAIIEDLVIAEGYRGMGIGKRILAEIAEWAVAQGVRRLDLLADRQNHTALKFYGNLNWVQTELICLQKKL